MSLPIIPWLGGKRRLADKLIPLFPPHDCYVEVFCGGAALYFLRPVPAQCEVLNDINGELTNLYRVVQHHLREFIDTFHWALSSRVQFDLFQETPPRILTDIQRAARFYYLRHHAFGGRVAGETYGTATTTPAPNLYRIEENLSAAHLRLAGTNIESLAWDECMRRYDRPHTFFYLDPPYWQTEGTACRSAGLSTRRSPPSWPAARVRPCCRSMTIQISGRASGNFRSWSSTLNTRSATTTASRLPARSWCLRTGRSASWEVYFDRRIFCDDGLEPLAIPRTQSVTGVVQTLNEENKVNDPIDLTRNRAPLDAAGGRTITVQLSPSAAAALDRLVASGYATTPAWAISSALIDVGRVLL